MASTVAAINLFCCALILHYLHRRRSSNTHLSVRPSVRTCLHRPISTMASMLTLARSITRCHAIGRAASMVALSRSPAIPSTTTTIAIATTTTTKSLSTSTTSYEPQTEQINRFMRKKVRSVAPQPTNQPHFREAPIGNPFGYRPVGSRKRRDCVYYLPAINSPDWDMVQAELKALKLEGWLDTSIKIRPNANNVVPYARPGPRVPKRVRLQQEQEQEQATTTTTSPTSSSTSTSTVDQVTSQ
jgi:mRNA-degrading endonuclease toxin of MazEF toxin-antitoxin module